MNLAVLRGEVAATPVGRDLPSGVHALQFDVAVDRGDGGFDRVPVSWLDPLPAEVGTLEIGRAVLVIGPVRRRFFRVGGVTQSRTEVVAAEVVPARRRSAAARALARATAALS